VIAARHRGAALVVVLAIGVGLTACSQSSGPAAEPVAVPTLLPFGDGTAEITSGVPEGFPSSVPLIDGEVLRGMIARDGTSTTYMVSIETDEADVATVIDLQMDDAGFSVSAETPAPESVLYDSDEWQVAVVVNPEGAPAGSVMYLATISD